MNAYSVQLIFRHKSCDLFIYEHVHATTYIGHKRKSREKLDYYINSVQKQ